MNVKTLKNTIIVNLKSKSKYLSLLLRHKPENANIVLDKDGWTDVANLVANTGITMEELEDIVANNDKKRFAFNDDKTKIRASQGHSNNLGLKLQLKSAAPPMVLYHGTSQDSVKSILKTGLDKRNRTHVHLSATIDTARNVGNRHKGTTVILEINGRAMWTAGFKFYLSDNNVWLTDYVDPKYIKVLPQLGLSFE